MTYAASLSGWPAPRQTRLVSTAVIVEAVRTPLGKRNGKLKEWHPVDLAAETLNAVVERAGIDPGVVDDVVMGCVMQVGEQGINIGRNAVLAAGWPEDILSTTVDRQCGSSQQAIHFAAQAVMSGTTDVVVAGGVQQMSAIPISAAMLAGEQYGFSDPFTGSTGWVERYGTQELSQFNSAEMIAEKWQLTRDAMEEFSVRSHERAIAARAEGRFEDEIEPLGDCKADEGPREPNWDKIRSLPTLQEGGRVTAACASQISDASAALLIVNEQGLKTHGLTPRARIHHLSVRADDPVWMLTAPIPADPYRLVRGTLEREHQVGIRNSGLNTIKALSPFFTGAAAVEKGLELIFPDKTIPQMASLDSIAMRDATLIPNNTQHTLLVFVARDLLVTPENRKLLKKRRNDFDPQAATQALGDLVFEGKSITYTNRITVTSNSSQLVTRHSPLANPQE